MDTKTKADIVLKVYAEVPGCRRAFQDPDTILADNCEDFEVTGLGAEIISQWLELANDRERSVFEKLFLSFAGIEFDTYLDCCLEVAGPQLVAMAKANAKPLLYN